MFLFKATSTYCNQFYFIDGKDEKMAKAFVEDHFKHEMNKDALLVEYVDYPPEKDIKAMLERPEFPKRNFNLDGFNYDISRYDLGLYAKTVRTENLHLEYNKAGLFLVFDFYKREGKQINLKTIRYSLHDLAKEIKEISSTKEPEKKYTQQNLMSVMRSLKADYCFYEKSGFVAEKNISLNGSSVKYEYDWSAKPYAGEPEKAYKNLLFTFFEFPDNEKVMEDVLKLIREPRQLEMQFTFEKREEPVSLYEAAQVNVEPAKPVNIPAKRSSIAKSEFPFVENGKDDFDIEFN